MEKEDQAQARKKAELILQVRAGQVSATEAAKELGLSRKSYYKWEKRALKAMLEGLCERKPGRPVSPPEDTEKEELRKKVKQLETRVHAQDMLLQLRADLMAEMEKKRRQDAENNR